MSVGSANSSNITRVNRCGGFPSSGCTQIFARVIGSTKAMF
jgi:hypothetical protein